MKDYSFDVFLSFTGADRELKTQIRNYLSDAGLSCYDSDLYCKGRFHDDFCEALDESRVYVLILTDSLRNDPSVTGKGFLTEVRREFSLACQLESENELNMVILCMSEFFRFDKPFHDRNDKMGWFFYSRTRGFSQINGCVNDDGSLDDKTLEKIAYQCRDFVEKRNAGEPVISQEPQIEIRKEKLPERALFCGRDAEIEAAVTALSSGTQTVVLSGIGGIGKTSLATEVARKCEELHYLDCPQIVNIGEHSDSRGALYTLTSTVGFVKSIYDISESLTKREEFERKLAALSALPETILLVIDNYNTLSKEDIADLQAKLKCRLLITTRVPREALGENSGATILDVNRLPEDSAYAMFSEISGKQIDKNRFINLYNSTGGHTITLCIMAKIQRAHGMEIDDLVSALGDLEGFDAAVDFRHNEYGDSDTVMGHLRQLFKISDFKESERNILRSMTLLYDGSIDAGELMRVLGLRNRNDIIALTKEGWLELLQREVDGETREYLYLHPMLSRLMAAELSPNVDNTKEMISYIAGSADKTQSALTYKDASLLETALYHACYVLAGGGRKLSRELWSRFVGVNRLFSDAKGTERRVCALEARLDDEVERSVVTSYGDMVLLEQYPTRVEIIEKYLKKLELNANDYKWVLRSLSVAIPHILGKERYSEFFKSATYKALHFAMERDDDFAVFDLMMYCFAADIKNKRKLASLCEHYVARRKKAGASNGSLTYTQMIAAVITMSRSKKPEEISKELMQFLAIIGEGKTLPLLRTVIAHPISSIRAYKAYNSISKLSSEDDPIAYILKTIVGESEAFADNGTLNAAALIDMAVELHMYRLSRHTTLQSASNAVMGVINLINQLPPVLVKGCTGVLVESIDMNNLSVESVSNLQVAALINFGFHNNEAIEQSRQLIAVLKKLRPEGHNDIITAIRSYGNVCQSFSYQEEAFRAYCEASRLIESKDPESAMLGDIARDMIKLGVFKNRDITLLESVYNQAIKDLERTDDEYFDSLLFLALQLKIKLEAKRIDLDSPIFKRILAELTCAAALVRRLNAKCARTLLRALSCICDLHISKGDCNTAEEIIDIAALLKKAKNRLARSEAEIECLNLSAALASAKDKQASFDEYNLVVKACVKRKMKLDVACAALIKMMEIEYYSIPLGRDEKFTPYMAFVKKKKLLARLDVIHENYSVAFMLSRGRSPEEELSDRLIALFRRSLLTRIVGLAKSKLPSNLGITHKEFSKMRSAEDLYAVVFGKLIQELTEQDTLASANKKSDV